MLNKEKKNKLTLRHFIAVQNYPEKSMTLKIRRAVAYRRLTCPSGRGFSLSDKNVCALTGVLVSWVYTFDKTSATVHLKSVHFTARKQYQSKNKLLRATPWKLC